MTSPFVWCPEPAITAYYLGYCLTTNRSPVHAKLAASLSTWRDFFPEKWTADAWLHQMAAKIQSTRGDAATGNPERDEQVASRLPSETSSLDRMAQWGHDQLEKFAPGWSEQLPARTRLLRELWEARGAGYLRQLDRQLGLYDHNRQDANRRIELAPVGPVSSVYPVTGGHGLVLPRASGILLEAMLTNASELAPEILRLAWLVTLQRLEQLGDHGSLIPAGRLKPSRRPLAALTLTLLLADDLEWLSVSDATIERTLADWLGLDGAELAEWTDRIRTQQQQVTRANIVDTIEWLLRTD